jgi:hypothetical protein
MSYHGKQGSGPLKPRCEALCQRLYGTEVVIAVSQTIPSGHRAAPHDMYAFHPHGTLLVVTLIPWFLWDYYEPQEIYKEKIVKALAEFKFHRLGEDF